MYCFIQFHVRRSLYILHTGPLSCLSYVFSSVQLVDATFIILKQKVKHFVTILKEI